jgi:hypothetical protein
MEVSQIILVIIPHQSRLMEKENQNLNLKPKKGLEFQQDQSSRNLQRRLSQRFREKRPVVVGTTIICQNLSSLIRSKINKLIAPKGLEVASNRIEQHLPLDKNKSDLTSKKMDLTWTYSSSQKVGDLLKMCRFSKILIKSLEMKKMAGAITR